MSETEKGMAHELFNWFGKSVFCVGIQKTKDMLNALLVYIAEKEAEIPEIPGIGNPYYDADAREKATALIGSFFDEEAEEQPTEINPVLASMTCQDCGTTENVGDTGLCTFCEEDRIVDEEERDFDEFEEAEEQ